MWLVPSHFQQIEMSVKSVSIVLSKYSIFMPVVYMAPTRGREVVYWEHTAILDAIISSYWRSMTINDQPGIRHLCYD